MSSRYTNGYAELERSVNGNGAVLATSEQSSAAADNGVIVVDLFGILGRRWPLIAFCCVLTLALIAVYAFTTPVIYESTGQVLVIPKDSRLPAQNVQGQLGFDQPDSAELLATHMDIIQSSRIVRRALEQNGLLNLPSILARIKEDQDSVDYVIENLSVSRGSDGAAVLSIAFRHTDPAECAQILNAVIDSYQEFIRDTVRGSGSEAAELITKAKDDLSSKLDLASDEYRSFREESPILWTTGQSLNIHQIRVAEWEASLSQLKLRKLAVQSRLQMVQDALKPENADKYTDLERFALIDQQDIERLGLMVEVEKGDPLSEAFQATQPVRQEVASAEYDRLVALRLEEKGLQRKLGAQHPQVAEIRDQIEALEVILQQNRGSIPEVEAHEVLDLNKMVAAYRALLEHDLTGIERQEHEYTSLIEQETARAKTLVSYELQEESLRQDMERTQGLYDTVLDRLREINLLKEYGGFITEVISPVDLGEGVWPSLPLLGALGLTLGGLFGCVLAVGAELADRSFHDEEEVKRELDLAILTSLPSMADKPLKSESALDSKLVAHHHPKSPNAENIRRLRTSLYFHTAGRSGNVVQITSPFPGDGKTTISGNLAISLSQTGKRVLLLDADMRRPRAHQSFGEELSGGLSEVLVGQSSVEDVVRHTEITNLDLLTAGTVPPNPAELLSMPAFPDLIEKLREQYDFVILDSPPVLSVNDPLVISRTADGVVLVVKLRKDSRNTAPKARAILAEGGAHLYGVALNNSMFNVGLGKRKYGYGYGYGAAYEYGYGRGNKEADVYYRE